MIITISLTVLGAAVVYAIVRGTYMGIKQAKKNKSS